MKQEQEEGGKVGGGEGRGKYLGGGAALRRSVARITDRHQDCNLQETLSLFHIVVVDCTLQQWGQSRFRWVVGGKN